MGFYLGEIREIRKDLVEAYGEGEYKRALLLGKQLLEIYMENEDSDNMEYAMDTHNVALVFESLGLYDKAAEYYGKAATLKKACTGESASYADSLNNLAIIYEQQGRADLALEKHRKVLEIRDLKLGRNHVDYIHALYNLGNAYEAMGNVDRALDLQAKALQHGQGSKELAALDLADIHVSLARNNEEKGNYKKSILYYETALDLIEKDQGTENFYYMMNMLSLAAVCEKTGFTCLAVEYCERAIEIRRKLLNATHLDYITNLNHLATVCGKDGQFDKAIALRRTALGLIEQVLGAEHVFFADMINSIGVDYCGKREYRMAERYCLKALFTKRRILPENDGQIAVTLMTLGAVCLERGEWGHALDYYREALEIRKEAFGEKSGLFADTLMAIARVYEEKGAYEGAAVCLQEAVEARKASGDDRSDIFVWVLHRLAEVRLKQGDFAEGTALCREALEITEKRYHKEHPRFAYCLKKLGRVYRDAEDLEKAMAAMEGALEIEQETLDEDNPYYLKTLEDLAEICCLRGDYIRAIRLYRQRNDLNFEETAEEQRQAATTLLSIANCYMQMEDRKKGEAHFAEAEGRMLRCGLEKDRFYKKELETFTSLQTGMKPRKIRNTAAERRGMQKLAERLTTDWKESQESRGQLVGEGEVVRLMALGELYCRLGEADGTKWYILAEKQAEGMQYARTCHCLAKMYLAQGQWDKALRKLINAKEYLAEYGDICTALYSDLLGLLGDVYTKKGERFYAIQYYRAWSKVYQELFLPIDKVYIRRTEACGNLLFEEAKYREALEVYSGLALSVRESNGDTTVFIELLFKTTELHVHLQNSKEVEACLSRILVLAAQNAKSRADYGRLLDRVGRIFAMAKLWDKAEETLRLAYARELEGKKSISKEGLQILLRLLREKGDEKAYCSIKNKEKLE